MTVIDADAHVQETLYSWSFMDESERKYTPMVVAQVSGDEMHGNQGNIQKEFWVIDKRIHAKEANVGMETSVESREMTDVSARLKHMDELGIDIAVLYPTLFLRPLTQNLDHELALYKSYNRWLAEIWKQAPKRLPWVAMPPLYSMDKVADELKFAKDNGACGIFMRGLECERVVSDSYFYPFYEAAQELDLALCFHSGVNSFLAHEQYRFATGFNRFKLATVGACHELLMKGVPEKFPALRWGFVEISAQWIPYVLNDLEIRLRQNGKQISKTPLADNNIYVAVQVTDDLATVVESAGEDNLMIATDYGHYDTSAEIEAFRLIRDDGKLDAHIVDKILDDNPRALYALD